MHYIKYTDMEEKDWNEYLDKIKGATFNYTAQKISFDYAYSKYIISNESFVVIEGKTPVGVSEIFIEQIGQNVWISWNGGYCLAPYFDSTLEYKVLEKISKKVMAYIEEVARRYYCQKIMLRMDPLGNPEQRFTFYNYNFLLKHGYIDESGLTQIIDLRRNKKRVYSDIRKGHKSDIKKGGVYHVDIYDRHTVVLDMVELYRKIYEKDAGKVTRNSELYQYYFDFIKNGLGLIAFGSIGSKEVGVAIVTIYKNTAYYSSYGELEGELGNIPIGHILQWQIINYLKDHGIEFYEIGEQFYGKTHYSAPNSKLIQISNFKRGFGGYTVPYWRGVKYMKEEDSVC